MPNIKICLNEVQTLEKSQQIFKIFVALLTHFGMQKVDTIIFVCGCLRTRRYAKRWFPNDGARRVGYGP